jgi:hypothetical protein
VNASDQSEPASNSSSTDFHTEMQRALRRQGLSEVTRARYARTVRRLGARTCPFATADAMTAELRTRSLPGADFQWLLLAHVLPRGFPCCRSYGLLHHRRNVLLQRVQLMLRVVLPPAASRSRRALLCRNRGQPMRIRPAAPPRPCIESVQTPTPAEAHGTV